MLMCTTRSSVHGVWKRRWSAFRCSNQLVDMWENMEARWPYSQYGYYGIWGHRKERNDMYLPVPLQGSKKSLWDKGPTRNIAWNGPISQNNLFASVKQFTYSFRIRPKNNGQRPQKTTKIHGPQGSFMLLGIALSKVFWGFPWDPPHNFSTILKPKNVWYTPTIF